MSEPENYQHPLGGPDWRYVPCECSTPHHFIAFMPDVFDTEHVDISFVSTRNGSLWHRVKLAWRHVMGQQDLVLADAIVSKKRLVDLMTGLQESA